MKKIIILTCISLLFLSINRQKSEKLIPEESIRFRIIANSNSNEDQLLKMRIVNNIKKELIHTEQLHSIKETRTYIEKRLPKIEQIVEKTLKDNKSNNTFHINYGKNFFPEKEYKNQKYKSGNYESLVIKLGKASGENFWCVLFPPLCFTDKEDNIEYKSFIKELIDKYF